MDIKAQIKWRQKLDDLPPTERKKLLSDIPPIALGGKNAPLLAAPLFLRQDTLQSFELAAQALVDAAVTIETHDSFQRGNVLFERLYESLSAGGKLFIDRSSKPTSLAIERRLRRLDGFITPQGHAAFIEINQSAPLAISFYERARQYNNNLAKTMGIRASGAANLYESLGAWFISELTAQNTHSSTATIAVSMETGYPAKFVDLPVACTHIAQAAKKLGYNLTFILAEPTAFTLSTSGAPLVNGRRFDLLWRNTVYLSNYDYVLEDYEHIRYGTTPMVNDLWAWLFRSKEFFAMLWDDDLRDAFQAVGVDVIPLRKTIPLSYSIKTITKAPAIQKDEWILKRCDDGFGKGIVFGSSLTEAEWRSFLKGARGDDWIAQKLVEPMVASLPIVRPDGTIADQQYQCDFDPYTVGGKVSGILVRALPIDAHHKKMNIVEGAAIGHVSLS